MSGCVFCEIIANRLPAVRIYEDEDVLALLDIGPVVKGHTLVIPKLHYDPIMETPPMTLQKMIVVVRRIARAQVRALQAEGVSVSQANGKVAGQVVPHIHFHVIPRFKDYGDVRHWTAGHYDDSTEMQTMGRLLINGLEP
jgi:histidine triad (HIT) family protein